MNGIIISNATEPGYGGSRYGGGGYGAGGYGGGYGGYDDYGRAARRGGMGGYRDEYMYEEEELSGRSIVVCSVHWRLALQVFIFCFPPASHVAVTRFVAFDCA